MSKEVDTIAQLIAAALTKNGGVVRNAQDVIASVLRELPQFQDGSPTGDRCTCCGGILIFSARLIGDGLCHYCAHKKLAAMKEVLISRHLQFFPYRPSLNDMLTVMGSAINWDVSKYLIPDQSVKPLYATCDTPLQGDGSKWNMATVVEGPHANEDVCILVCFADGQCIVDLGDDRGMTVIPLSAMQTWTRVDELHPPPQFARPRSPQPCANEDHSHRYVELQPATKSSKLYRAISDNLEAVAASAAFGHPPDNPLVAATQQRVNQAVAELRDSEVCNYVPFTWEDRDQLRGRWVVWTDGAGRKTEILISWIHPDPLTLTNAGGAGDLLTHCVFLDTGEPCGKRVGGTNAPT